MRRQASLRSGRGLPVAPRAPFRSRSSAPFLIGFIMVPVLALLQVRGSLLRAFGKVARMNDTQRPDADQHEEVAEEKIGRERGQHPHVRAPMAMAVMLAGTILSLAIAS
jgi:hypothetical protein